MVVDGARDTAALVAAARWADERAIALLMARYERLVAAMACRMLGRARLGIHPAVDSVAFASRLLETGARTGEHALLASDVRALPRRGQEPGPTVETSGIGALAPDDRRTFEGARRLRQVLGQPMFIAAPCAGLAGEYLTLAACAAILQGKANELPEQAFALVGTLDQALAKAQTNQS